MIKVTLAKGYTELHFVFEDMTAASSFIDTVLKSCEEEKQIIIQISKECESNGI